MSTYDAYDDEPRRYRSVRTRPRERDEPDYVREETYIERGKGPGPRNAELVYRGREDSIEDIPRDFPPPGRGYGGRREYDDYGPPRRSKSAGGRRYPDDYDDDGYTDYGAGAAAGYAAGRSRGGGKSRVSRRDDRDYESDYSDSPPRRNERKKSGVGDALEGLGLGGLVGGLLGKDKDKNKGRSRSGSRSGRSVRSRSRAGSRYSDESGRSRSGPGDKNRGERKWAQAAQAALVAGAVEAFRARKVPGPWTGDKGKRIATAAIGAGGIDGLIDRDPDKKTKRHLAEAVIGGLAANRLANGPRSRSRGRGLDDERDFSPDSRAPRSRSRSIIDRLRGRSQSRGRAPSQEGGGQGIGALKGLAGAGAVAAAGKAIYDRVRSKSRKRRSPSRDSSADSYVPSRTRRRDRGRSPRSDTGSTRQTEGAGDRGVARGTSSNGDENGQGNGQGNGEGNGEGNGNDGNVSSDSSSTTDMEKTRKHMRGKELITAGIATVATIHAAHGVYSSMEAHEKRHRLVAEGEMSPEEARKKQTKAWIQDAAAVGIAALGIKGAFSEWKEMNEQRREIQEIEKRKAQRRKKRVARQKQEERERHERMMSILEKNPQLAMGYHLSQNAYPLVPPGPNQAGNSPAPPPDLSGNPYAPRDGGSQRH
ncbi:Hypothetical predicted protein [Lecanosticta acicola]|uniref:Uncharacterized protein n=1 Tax=Lecanosticta acicola TaxID=111012 RepID=A0AAI8Z5I4_9PEZI|nr:Hypothetical predicted protein [Lecanosticta acicola]